MRVPGEEPVEYDVVAGIGNGERPGEECADMLPGCSGCCGKRLRVKLEPNVTQIDHD